MFKINIRDLEVFAIIGILKKERTKKQKITINAKISYNSKKYIDYAKIVNIITTLLIKKKYLLVEDSLLDISKKLKKSFKAIKKIKLSIDKNDILKNCIVGVEFSVNF